MEYGPLTNCHIRNQFGCIVDGDPPCLRCSEYRSPDDLNQLKKDLKFEYDIRDKEAEEMISNCQKAMRAEMKKNSLNAIEE